MGFIAGVALRLNQPGEIILNGLILCWAGGKAVDVRHAVRGVDGGGLAALWQAAAGLRRSGGAQMRLWEAGGWREDSCGHAMAVASAHRVPIRQPAHRCPGLSAHATLAAQGLCSLPCAYLAAHCCLRASSQHPRSRTTVIPVPHMHQPVSDCTAGPLQRASGLTEILASCSSC